MIKKLIRRFGTLLFLTRQELGRLVNCSRQMATRVLQTLEAQGLIKVEGKNIIVYRSFSDSDREKSVNQSSIISFPTIRPYRSRLS